jgi:iron complex outermembrane receptor protein
MKKLIFLFLLATSTVYSQDTLNIDSSTVQLGEVTIQGIRAGSKTPVTQKTINEDDIDIIYHTQELPLLLNTTPNVTSSTDGGHNMGYTYFRLRGIDQTRINMTLDGVPLNEPEEQGVYFSNYPDFTNSIKSMQIQRGVGTSTNGVSSYAGSINFESPTGLKKGTEGQIGYGSFNTYRVSIENSTGLLKNKMAFYTRYSNYASDGYKYNSGGKGQSFFLSGGYYGTKDFIKITAFNGHTTNQMVWFAVSEDDIKVDPRTNYNTTRENDDFTQSMIILKHKHFFKKSNLTTTAFYNRLDGDWGLDLLPLGGGNDVLNYNLGSNFYGLTSNYNLTKDKFRLNIGVSVNMYNRRHAMTILPNTDELYSNKGLKNEVSSFVKLEYDIKKFTLFGDAQIRYVDFKYQGDMSMIPFNWTFFNPKGGIMFTQCKHYNFYTSVGQTHREPTRNDIFMGEDNPINYTSVNPESVIDYELGTNINLENFKLQANLYYMDFKNEITLLGAIGSNGLPLMANVENSFRSGVEVDMTLRLFSKKKVNLLLTNTSSYSYNRIKDGGVEFDPLYTPNLIINQGIMIKDSKDIIRVGFDVKYHSKSYIDMENTLTTPEFIVLNAQVDYRFYKQHTLSIRVNNLTNESYYTNGYAVGTDRHFFVNPPFNFFTTLKIKF